MRTDIAIDFDTADLSLSRKPPRYTVGFRWVDEDEGNVYCECEFDDDITENLKRGIGIRVKPMLRYKPVMISFLSVDGTGTTHPVLNPSTKGKYFQLVNLDGERVYASTLPMISEDMTFQVNLDNDKAYVSDMYSRDLMLKTSLEQNEELLLRCYSGNLYQHPTTGVGLLSFLHANMNDNKLGEKIKEEFNHDNMFVEDVRFDYETGKIVIKAREVETNG